ncbi:MAG: ABC transporter permease [Thermosphaera sp.]
MGIKKTSIPQEATILGITGVLIGVFYYTSRGTFLSSGVIRTMLTSAPELGIIALGVTLLMVAGEFDLSVGSCSALAALLAISCFQRGWSPFGSLIMALLAGVLMGAVNGIITVKFGIPSFIATLGTMLAGRGLVYVITMGRVINFNVEKQYPGFYSFLVGNVGGAPAHFFWFLVLTLGAFSILDRHRFGNHIYATGGNKEAARAMGINVEKVKIVCFLIVGMLAALAGVMRATRIQGFYAQQGEGMELMAIAAAVIGGTSLFGGAGTVIGTFFGTIVVTFLEYGLIVSRVSGYWFRVVLGSLIVLVVIVDRLIRGRV